MVGWGLSPESQAQGSTKIVSKYMPGIEDTASQSLGETVPSFPSVSSFESFHATQGRAVTLRENCVGQLFCHGWLEEEDPSHL